MSNNIAPRWRRYLNWLTPARALLPAIRFLAIGLFIGFIGTLAAILLGTAIWNILDALRFL